MRISPFAAIALCSAFLLTGCTLSNTALPIASTGAALRGNLHGGQQPIVGAHVYLLAAGTSGYGGASTSLLATNVDGNDAIGGYVLSGSDGGYSIGGDYTCTPDTQVYLYALGGNPGAGVNSASGLLAALGNCPGTGNFASTVPFTWINEVSTIAAAYAFSAFATDATHVSSSGTTLAQTGIANAFANATNLAGISTGAALTTTPAGNGSVPRNEINTLANILAACVNSSGPTSSSCATLFANASSNGTSGTAPTDTATAAINIAHNPAAGVATLFSIPAPTAAFQPVLSSQPNDFTISLTYTGGGIGTAGNVAIDAAGNVWISNLLGMSKLSPQGAAISPFLGYLDLSLNNAAGIGIDLSGNVWVANTLGLFGTLSEFNNSGAFLRTATYPHPGSQLAIDPSAHIWAPSYDLFGSNVAELSSSGGSINTFNTGGLNHPTQVAADGSGNIWIGNLGNGTVTKLNGSGVAAPSSPFSNGGISAPSSLALDSFGDLWVLNNDSSLSAISNTGTALSGSPWNTGSSQNAAGLAIDGSDNVFALTSFFNLSTLSQNAKLLNFSHSGTPLSTSGLSAPNNAAGLAIDGSGNIWIADGLDVVQVLGVASPVVTPVAAAVTNNTIGTRP